MSVGVQVPDAPEEDRDLIAKRAAQRGQTLQAYLLELIHLDAHSANNAVSFDRTASARVTIPDGFEPERIVREGRDSGWEVDR
jgi:hypothetical protein